MLVKAKELFFLTIHETKVRAFITIEGKACWIWHGYLFIRVFLPSVTSYIWDSCQKGAESRLSVVLKELIKLLKPDRHGQLPFSTGTAQELGFWKLHWVLKTLEVLFPFQRVTVSLTVGSSLCSVSHSLYTCSECCRSKPVKQAAQRHNTNPG